MSERVFGLLSILPASAQAIDPATAPPQSTPASGDEERTTELDPIVAFIGSTAQRGKAPQNRTKNISLLTAPDRT